MKNYNLEKIHWDIHIYTDEDNNRYTIHRNKYLSENGNPIYSIRTPFYGHLPIIQGFRRNLKTKSYTAQSYNIQDDFNYFMQAYKNDNSNLNN